MAENYHTDLPLDPLDAGGDHSVAGPDGGSPEEPDGGSGTVLADWLAQLTETISAMRQESRAADDRAAARERVIDRLHDENDRLRAGERHLLLRPIQVDLQRLRNELLREARTLPASYDATRAAVLLTSFADSVELTLERCGVQVVRPDPGSVFDSTRQRAAGTVPADAAELDATVDEVVADGYFDTVAQRVTVPAAVRVRRWQPNNDHPPAPAGAKEE